MGYETTLYHWVYHVSFGEWPNLGTGVGNCPILGILDITL